MKELTEKQKEFARCYFECKNGTKAYMDSYGKGKTLKESTCATESSKLLKNPKVQEYLAGLNEKAESPLVLTKQQRMIWLSQVVRTPLGKVNTESDLCQEYSVTTGENSSTERIKMPSKLGAIAELNKMDGAYEPDKVEHTVLGVDAILSKLNDKPIKVQDGQRGEKA